MKRISIVVEKNMNSGQKANVAAIIMGQLSQDSSHLYGNLIRDQSGAYHAGIAVNLVVLDGGKEQLLSLVNNAVGCDVACVVFSSTGQSLSNNYPEYQKQISSMDTRSTDIVGVGIVGEDSTVRTLTKKFSLVK